MNQRVIGLFIIATLLVLAGCGTKTVLPQAEFDTPGHHVATGDKFLAANRLNDAAREYERALALDPEYAPAHVGTALVTGFSGDYENALERLNTAAGHAADNREQVLVSVGRMRVYTRAGAEFDDDWLEEVEDDYRDAIDLDPGSAPAYYYMGRAYTAAYRFDEAETMFKTVIELQNGLVEDADREYALVQKIVRAMPGTTVGKKIALLETIGRADAAALFIEELKIDTRFKRQQNTAAAAFRSPPEKTFSAGSYVKAPAMTDIDGHVLKADIEAVVNVGIKGLQPYPDHTFRPDDAVTRAEFAMMLEDILIKINRDEKLSTRFFGSESPFPDIRNSAAYFNAVMVCVSSNLMSVKDPFTREFAPMLPISGADALLAVRVLKSELR